MSGTKYSGSELYLDMTKHLQNHIWFWILLAILSHLSRVLLKSIVNYLFACYLQIIILSVRPEVTNKKEGHAVVGTKESNLREILEKYISHVNL